jgi:hypothetical protein
VFSHVYVRCMHYHWLPSSVQKRTPYVRTRTRTRTVQLCFTLYIARTLCYCIGNTYGYQRISVGTGISAGRCRNCRTIYVMGYGECERAELLFNVLKLFLCRIGTSLSDLRVYSVCIVPVRLCALCLFALLFVYYRCVQLFNSLHENSEHCVCFVPVRLCALCLFALLLVSLLFPLCAAVQFAAGIQRADVHDPRDRIPVFSALLVCVVYYHCSCPYCAVYCSA